jgi:translation initiation factor 1
MLDIMSDLLGGQLCNELDILNTVHIRLQQRNGRKCWTFIENLVVEEGVSLKKVLKVLKKKLACNGSIEKNKENDGEESSVLVLQGDHLKTVRDFLVKEGFCKKEEIVTHGY